MKVQFLIFLFSLISLSISSQDGLDLNYKIIAEGNDSPFNNLKIVCFNKYFNLEYTNGLFRRKYGLNDKSIYKKKMLAQIFIGENDQGFDQIKINRIKETPVEIIIDYDILNSNVKNDTDIINPFLIIQIKKSRKPVSFIENGIKLTSNQKLYIGN